MEPNKSISFSSMDEVLKFAIEKEEEAHQFYLQWADKATSPAVSNTLKEFAAEELKHKNLLLGVQKGHSFPKQKHPVSDLKIADYFSSAEVKGVMTYQDALRVAIQREIVARDTYRLMALNTTDTELKQIFTNLEQEEAKHKQRLESIYDDDFLTEN